MSTAFQYAIRVGGQNYGVKTEGQLRGLAIRRKIGPLDYVYPYARRTWVRAGSLDELRAIFKAQISGFSSNLPDISEAFASPDLAASEPSQPRDPGAPPPPRASGKLAAELHQLFEDIDLEESQSQIVLEEIDPRKGESHAARGSSAFAASRDSKPRTRRPTVLSASLLPAEFDDEPPPASPPPPPSRPRWYALGLALALALAVATAAGYWIGRASEDAKPAMFVMQLDGDQDKSADQALPIRSVEKREALGEP
ncbi:MAG: hypothetical protein C4523_06075 [Myxococcales bacterium]|nr:MAG: hypothetical protein C4523_06075 [Myxococcales bacterium]